MEYPVKVSIQCLVYNHEPYLRQCLDGFVMQKTSFRFEAIIHDDVSTDGSADIIREYARKYPEIIKPIYETENQYSKHDDSLLRVLKKAMTGEYIAICEGDDYWTDPLKLQKQVDYLESHPECALCFHNAIQHWQDGSQPDSPFSELEERDYTGLEVTENWIIPTASMVYRSSCLPQYETLMKKAKRPFTFGDTPLAAACANCGTLHALKDTMSVYRRTPDSFTLRHSAKQYYATGLSWLEFFRVFGDEYKPKGIDQAVYNFIMCDFYSLKEHDFRLFFRSFYQSFICHPVTSLKKIAGMIRERNLSA